ncbi:hypothetical protein [Lysinibacillus xylanilyticus]|uniref:hypothetical protein n=1 Tax=Lysinibacillus xylanilyticus TaxID=582475 RepID=UPI0037FBD2C3
MDIDFSKWTILDYATLGSFVFGIVFFAYQEITGSKNRKKEVVRLKEEIINLIIRNHVNSKIRIAEVDFEILINGFEKVKYCKFYLDKNDLLEMIYAKVSENEHITNETRVEMLQQLQWIIFDMKYMNERSKSSQTLFWELMLGSTGSIAISLLVMGVFYKFFNLSTIANTNAMYALLVIIGFTFVVLKYFKPLLEDFLTAFFIDIKKEKKISEDNEISNINKIYNTDESLEIANIEVNDDNLKLINYTYEAKEVMRILELRIIFESQLRKLYLLSIKDRDKNNLRLPVVKILTSLMVSNILDEEIGKDMKRAYVFSNSIVHELEIPDNVHLNKIFSLFEASIEIINRELQMIESKKI